MLAAQCLAFKSLRYVRTLQVLRSPSDRAASSPRCVSHERSLDHGAVRAVSSTRFCPSFA